MGFILCVLLLGWLGYCFCWARSAVRGHKTHKLSSAHGKEDRGGVRRPAAAPPALTVAARRSVAGIELRPTVFKSEGMGRERKVRGFHSYDSGKGKASGRGSAPSSHGCGHGSSWGAWLRQGEGGVQAGSGGGGYQGVYRERNRTKMARLGRSTAAFVTLFLLEEQRRGN